MPNKSSAAAWNVASTTTVPVLIALVDFSTGVSLAVVGPGTDSGGVAETSPVDCGVEERLPLTVRSLPWVSISAFGNSASFVSRAVASRVLASLYNESTDPDAVVFNVQLNYRNVKARAIVRV